MINLFEYQNKESYPGSFDEMESFLDEIWKRRERSPHFYTEDEDKRIEEQRFIQFLHKHKQIKSNKYVGVICFGDQKINLLPKIFYDPERNYSDTDLESMHSHILWWLSYCRKIRFPNYSTSLGKKKSDFFEVLIYLFSKYTRELLSSSIFQQYEEVNRELTFIKGRLNTARYIDENLSKGRWHKMHCTYDSFEMDNTFNRIIKFVATQLFSITKNQNNKTYLREILFILDEVSDERATAEDCANIKFNPMFGEFETVRDYCHLFLSNSISFSYKNELKLFAFLLPMEYVFEDFVFGFIEKEIRDVSAKAQSNSLHLDTDKNFRLRPDLVLDINGHKVIADTKYKIVYTDESDPKKGITQTDLYQMLAYAVRFEVDDVILFYPNTIKNYNPSTSELFIHDRLAGDKKVRIRVYQLPIVNVDMFEGKVKSGESLEKMFSETRLLLKERLGELLM
ncbi:MAG: hypothetical protein HKN22_07135 [Bacteroidia bacterium]|nr:hypothetical protein [Bacteroidia bacterium]